MMKKVVCIVAMLLVGFSFQSTIQANTHQIRCSSELYVLRNGKREVVNKGFDFNQSKENEYLLTFKLSSTKKEKIDINLLSLQGFTINEKSIKVNGIAKRMQQLHELTLDKSMRIEMNVTYQANSTEVATSIQVSTLDTKENHSFTYYYTINQADEHAKTYEVRFYGIANELLDTQHVIKNESAHIPQMDTVGYTTYGFNTKRNGKGNYYNGEPIHSNVNFYLVYEPTHFNVNYYIDHSLYKQERVKYGEYIVHIEAPTKEGYTFIMWLGKTGKIYEDVDLHAVYQNDATKEYVSDIQLDPTELQLTIKKINENNGEYQKNQYRDLKDNKEYYAFVDKLGKLSFISNKMDTNQESTSWLGFVAVGLIGITLSVYKAIKERKK